MPRRGKTTTTDLHVQAWNDLLHTADRLNAVAPWHIVEDDCVLGVGDQRTGEIDWCSIMGQAGETFGVVFLAETTDCTACVA